jgi:choline-sulfatase
MSGITRRELLKRGALAAASLALSPRFVFPARAARPRKPNILFLNTDQQHILALSARGNPHLRTPNMDRLAKRGVTFVESVSANPVCAPARCCWFTGRASSETGIVWNTYRIRPGLPDLGTWLRERGYETAYIGKFHVPGLNEREIFNLAMANANVFGQHDDAVMSRAAEAFLRTYSGENPFFLSVGFLQPHDNNFWVFEHCSEAETPPPVSDDRLPPLPPNFDCYENEPVGIYRPKGAKSGRLTQNWSTLQWRHYIWSYYRMVEMVDADLGRVLDALADSKHAANTLLIFSCDHGEGLGHHRLWSKGFLYDEALKVPLVISWPGQVAEGVIDRNHLVSGLDFAPTVCDYAGISPPPKMRGYSLRPLLEGKAKDWREFAVSESNVNGQMIRTPEYKLITYKRAAPDQLFDMRNDPWETRNLVNDSRHADTLRDLRRLLLEYDARLEKAELRLANDPHAEQIEARWA